MGDEHKMLILNKDWLEDRGPLNPIYVLSCTSRELMSRTHSINMPYVTIETADRTAQRGHRWH